MGAQRSLSRDDHAFLTSTICQVHAVVCEVQIVARKKLLERTCMGTPNYYDLSGPSTRIAWYPSGQGGPIKAGGPPANAPVLIYSSSSLEVTASGDDLTIAKTPAG